MSERVRSKDLLDKIAGKLREPASFSDGAAASILAVSGARYGANQLDPDLTQPTGFDPQAAALFEAVVECAYLVAAADGALDDTEQAAFEHVVLTACGGSVGGPQLRGLLTDLADLLGEDGADQRVRMVARTITRPEQAREVLRVAALVAQVSEGVSAVERGVLEKLAGALQLGVDAADGAIEEARRALSD